MPDDDLEHMLTQSLRTMSEDADPTTTGDLAERARGTTRTRRRNRRAVAVAVAAVIVAPIVYVAVQNPTDNSRGTNAPAVSGVPSDWRVESYGDVELRVPPSWGWAGVPTVDHDNLLFCGTGAFAVPSGKPDPDGVEGVPYVGRAGFGMTDLCQLERDVTASSPFVWFDSPLEPGSSTVTGIPVETIEVAGTRVSVGDQDADRQAQILSTVEQSESSDGNGCVAAPPEDLKGSTIPATTEVNRVELCVYHQPEKGEPFFSFSSQVGHPRAQEIFDAIQRTTIPDGNGCPLILHRPSDLVQMRFHTSDGVVIVNASISPSCSGYNGSRPLTPENVRPWSTGGVALYISAGQLDPSIGQFFHPVPG